MSFHIIYFPKTDRNWTSNKILELLNIVNNFMAMVTIHIIVIIIIIQQFAPKNLYYLKHFQQQSTGRTGRLHSTGRNLNVLSILLITLALCCQLWTIVYSSNSIDF